MNYLKKIGFVLSAAIFCLSLAALSASAQPGKAKYGGNNGKHKGWTQGRHNGWNRNQTIDWNRRGSYRRTNRGIFNNRITWQEYRRLSRQKSRLGRTENRYYRDGVLSSKEQGKLDKKYGKYRRSVYKARRR